MRLCPWCGASLEGERPNKRFCNASHRNMYNHAKESTIMQLSLLHFGVAPVEVKEHLISEREVRRLEGLNKPHPQRVHGRLCNCPDCRDARQKARLDAARAMLQAVGQEARG